MMDGVLALGDFCALCLCMGRAGKGVRLIEEFGGEGLFAGTVNNCGVTRGRQRAGKNSRLNSSVCTVISIEYGRMTFCT